MSNIGFIGLGNMGLPMAINLAKAGHTLKVFDTVPEQLDKAASEGMETCLSAAQVCEGSDIVITMLPNGDIVRSVFDEIVPTCQKGAVIIDSSTIDVSSAKHIHKQAANAGLGCLDAPVSGGIGGAQAGTLTFMIGGPEESFDKAQSVLDIMGGRLVHCGEGGAGQSAKICNNMLLGISMIGACETFTLGKKLGLDPQALFDVVSTSSGFCWSVNTYCPEPGVGPQSPADNDYQPGFAAALMLKDLLLSQQAATENNSPTPMGKHATAIYQQMNDAGGADTDFSGIIKYLEQVS